MHIKLNTKVRNVELHELGTMLKLVHLEYPNITNEKELATLISEEFNVKCTKKDIIGYERLHIQPVEDYELEGRRHKYGISM